MPATAFEFPAGLPWLNAAHPLTPADLSGRVTVLHFFACGQIAALDPLADLSGPAERLGARLAVIGVHCPQFTAERDREHLRQNLFRLGYRLPVVHDRDCAVARACAITGLPALVVLGPDGSIKARAEGAGAGAELAATVEALTAGLAEPAPLPVSLEEDVTDPGLVSFPEGLLGLSAQELYLADTGNHRLLGVNVDRPSLRGPVAKSTKRTWWLTVSAAKTRPPAAETAPGAKKRADIPSTEPRPLPARTANPRSSESRRAIL